MVLSWTGGGCVLGRLLHLQLSHDKLYHQTVINHTCVTPVTRIGKTLKVFFGFVKCDTGRILE